MQIAFGWWGWWGVLGSKGFPNYSSLWWSGCSTWWIVSTHIWCWVWLITSWNLNKMWTIVRGIFLKYFNKWTMPMGVINSTKNEKINRSTTEMFWCTETTKKTYLKMHYNENSHIKLTIEPCLCCVQVTIYCCGHVFLFIILLQFDRQNETPLLRFLKFPALHWFPTKTHWKSTMKSTI